MCFEVTRAVQITFVANFKLCRSLMTLIKTQPFKIHAKLSEDYIEPPSSATPPFLLPSSCYLHRQGRVSGLQSPTIYAHQDHKGHLTLGLHPLQVFPGSFLF